MRKFAQTLVVHGLLVTFSATAFAAPALMAATLPASARGDGKDIAKDNLVCDKASLSNSMQVLTNARKVVCNDRLVAVSATPPNADHNSGKISPPLLAKTPQALPQATLSIGQSIAPSSLIPAKPVSQLPSAPPAISANSDVLLPSLVAVNSSSLPSVAPPKSPEMMNQLAPKGVAGKIVITEATNKFESESTKQGSTIKTNPTLMQHVTQITKPASANETAKPASPANPAKTPLQMYESGQLVVYWKDAGDAAIGLIVMAREFKLNPVSENRLPNLGGVIATFKLSSQREAERVKGLLAARYPTWHIDFQTRYLPHQSVQHVSSGASNPAPNSRPRLFASAKIDYPMPAPDAGIGIRVGLVDTPVESSYVLKNATMVRRSFLNPGEISASASHGNALAALIAGREDASDFIGISPGASLHIASIMRTQAGLGGGMGSNGASNTATLVRALDWLLGERVQIINLSLGGAGDRIMEEAIGKVLRSRVIIIAAAGNQGEDAPPSYPAAYPGVIAVTASDALDRVFTQANRGTYISLTAPGVDVWVPDPSGGRYVSGTSFAAAIVSGAVAVMLSRHVAIDVGNVRGLLCRSARDLGGDGVDPVFGCGLLQLGATLAGLPIAARSAMVSADGATPSTKDSSSLQRR